MSNNESILNSVKKSLGLPSDYTPFDADVIMHTNSAISVLTQLGVGPETGVIITDHKTPWSDLLGEDQTLEMAKSYVYLVVKQLFDPPENGSINVSIEKMKDAYEWRLTIAVRESERRVEEAL